MPRTLVCSPAAVHGLRANGLDVGNAGDTARLLETVRRGGHVSLEVEATTFVQRDRPNRNFVRFEPAILAALAASYKGAPFQRNHSTDVEDRGGTVSASELVAGPDGPAMRMTLALTKPWAVEGVLDGTIDRFSIAWNPTGDVVCSVCREPVCSFLGWMFPGCDHIPGDEYQTKKAGPSVVCELVFTSAEGTEVSAVSVPGVVGTEIEAVRAARLSARGPAQGARMSTFASLCTILAIAPTSELSAIEAEVTKVVAARERAETLLAAERDAGAARVTALAAAEAELVKVRGELVQLGAARGQEQVDALIAQAKREGRILPLRDADGKEKLGADGKPEQSPLEKRIRKLAAADLKDATALVAELPMQVPLGRQGAANPDVKPEGAPTALAVGALTEEQKNIALQLGLTVEQYAATLASRGQRN